MIKLRLKGRLGNQLFIYAFARCLTEKYNQEVLIYDRKDEANPTWYSHLDGYFLHPSVQFTSSKKEIMRMGLFQKLLFIWDRISIRNKSHQRKHQIQMRHMPYYLTHGLLLCNDGYFNLPDRITDNLFCDGYFQSPRFFDHIRNNLLKELAPVDKLTQQELLFVRHIEESNAVCVTIRLGDYINNSVHQVCTKTYYNQAMKKMKDMEPDCMFFIFSDEVQRAEQIFDFEYPVIYDSGLSKDTISLYIMSKCKHFIISNSSFSWWAQYLSLNSKKRVIAPSRWYAADVPCDIMQDEWITIDV